MTENTSEIDNFKAEFKYYKQKAQVPSLERVLNFDSKISVSEKALEPPPHDFSDINGVQSPTKWEFFEINEVPGLYFIKNAFSVDDQLYWSQKCLEEYTVTPYVTNLDIFQSKDSVDLVWKDSEKMYLSHNGIKDVDFLTKTPIWKMRWSTLGYHHDWSTKHYRKDFKSGFPKDLGDVCSLIARCLGLGRFKPEAAIVNFYHTRSTLAPHKDISEVDLSLPLFSISLGLDAIFLIGGDTKETKPRALLLRSGDVIVMSGKSRTAYHALPRVLDTSRLDLSEQEDFVSLCLQHSRINLNIRQVESESMLLPE